MENLNFTGMKPFENNIYKYNTRPLKSGFWPQIGFWFWGGGVIDNIFLVTWNTTKGCETHMFWVIGLREGTPGYSSSKTEGWDIHNDRKYTLTLKPLTFTIFLVSFYNDEGSLTFIFWPLGLREGKLAYFCRFQDWEMGNPQVPKINCYSLKFRQKLSQHFGDMSQCKRCEKLIFTFIGVPGRGKAKPTCKAEDRRSTSRKFDWHTFCQRHYFADMSQYWDMSDPHFWGFGMTGACTEGERFKARKLDSHTLAIETCNILGRCHNAEGYQAYIICESSCQGKGRLLFEVPRLGAHN